MNDGVCFRTIFLFMVKINSYDKRTLVFGKKLIELAYAIRYHI